MSESNLSKMNPKIKKKWIEALRSRKYKQCQKYLHNETGYCCLGVLCDLHSKTKNGSKFEKVANFADEIMYSYLDEDGELPQEVVEWAGLDSNDPELTTDGRSASELNDNGKKFYEIADYIERNL